VVGNFLAAHPDARSRALPAGIGHKAGEGRQNLPGNEGMDGFYYAVVEKTA
jgi:16S rRNA (cytosine967-C5)-methyltransferase